MLEFLGLVFGGALRLFPTVLEFFQKAKDAEMELKRMEVEAKLEDQRSANRMKEIAAASQAQLQLAQVQGQAAADVEELVALGKAVEAQGKLTGDKWLDRINVSVRPILTYWWCIVLHTAHKVVVVMVSLQANSKLADWAPIIYTDFDRSVVGSIIGFWFVDRSLRNAGKK